MTAMTDMLARLGTPAWRRRRLARATSSAPKTVLISGATGFIGRALAYRLIERGDYVIVLTRDLAKAADLFGPYVEAVTDLRTLRADRRIDAIVNLAGAPIAGGRWTRRRKIELLASRLTITQALLECVARLETKPRTWLNASAIGYYGVHADDEGLHEKCAPQARFQSRLCTTWEAAAAQASAFDVKVAMLRIGLVLGRDGGALPALSRPVRLGLGCVLGSGAQWVSWIHRDDLVDLAIFVLDQETLAGPINATAPSPVRHTELMRAIAATLQRRLLPFRVPASGLRALLGELAELFVDGQRVPPVRATALGFGFRHATIESALAEALGDPRTSLDGHATVEDAAALAVSSAGKER
jgi:uncharacterized protein